MLDALHRPSSRRSRGSLADAKLGLAEAGHEVVRARQGVGLARLQTTDYSTLWCIDAHVQETHALESRPDSKMLKAATVPVSQTRKYANYVCDTSIVVAQKACQRVRALSNAPEKPSDVDLRANTRMHT